MTSDRLISCLLDTELRWLERFVLGLVNRAIFHWVSKVIRVLLWFCFTSPCDWLKKLAPLSRPIKSKTQLRPACTNRDFLAPVFPRLAPVSCICFEFWLVHWVICVCCDFSRPICIKVKLNQSWLLLTLVFPCLASATCIYFDFWLVHWIVCDSSLVVGQRDAISQSIY